MMVSSDKGAFRAFWSKGRLYPERMDLVDISESELLDDLIPVFYC